MSTYTEYRVTCNYMHYTQTLAASSQLADILDVYNTLATKKVNGLCIQKVTTTVETLNAEQLVQETSQRDSG